MIALTREYLANYPYLQSVIERDEKKLQKYINNPPVAEYGKVYGSNANFPYEARGFTVSGPNIADDKAWKQRISDLKIKISCEKDRLKELMVEIDELILSIENPRDKLIFEYLYHDGMTQQQVADLLYIDRSYVSKIIDKYVRE